MRVRPKLLEIEGLQSFTDLQKIDFESLGQTGLFGIFGPTGSGKSTILDAITFALYGRIKRAEGGTQGIINSNRDTASVAFTFELTRDGRRKTYRAERTYRRKKNSPNACEPKVVRLIQVTDEGDIPLCDKAMEVSNYIKDLLGLSNDDFTRAVVLPQNSFQEFLLLNNSERRGMLERIFYLEEYGKQLTDKLGRKISRMRSQLDMLSGELKGYADASDESLSEAEKAMENAAAERKRVEKKLKVQEGIYNEAKEVWNLTEELLDFVRREEKHVAVATEMDQMRIRLDKAIKADGLLEMILKNKELKEKVQQIQGQLEEVLAVFPGVVSSLDEVKAAKEAIKKEIATQQPKLLGQRARLVDALDINREIEDFSAQISKLCTSAAKLKSEIAAKQALIKDEAEKTAQLACDLQTLDNEAEKLRTDPEYRQELQEAAKLENEVFSLRANVKELEGKETLLECTASGLEQKLTSIRNEIEASKKEYDTLEAERRLADEAKPAEKKSIMKSIDSLHRVEALCQILELTHLEMKQQRIKLEQEQANLVTLEKKAQALTEAAELAAIEYERCEMVLKKAVDKMDTSTAAMLSQRLREGEPCPVCGSENHPLPAVCAEGQDIAQLEKEAGEASGKLSVAQIALKEAHNSALVAGEQLKLLKEQVVQTRTELDNKTKAYETQRQKLPENLSSLEPEQIRGEIEKDKKSFGDKLEAIDAWEEKQEEYKERLRTINDAIADKRLSEKGIVTELKVNQEGIEQTRKSIDLARDMLESAQSEYSLFLEKNNIDGANAELKRIVENDRELLKQQKQIEKMRQIGDSKRLLVDKLSGELQVLNEDHIKLEADINSIDAQKQSRVAKLREVVGEADAEEEIQKIDQTLESYSNRENECSQKADALEKQSNELSSRKYLLENQVSIYSESLKKDENKLNSALVDKGFADGAEVEASVVSREQQKAIRESIEKYDSMLINIRAQKSLVEKKLNCRSITEQEWVEIEKTYSELLERRQECVSNSEVARNYFINLNKKHDKWLELSKVYYELSHKQGFFEQIQKLLKAEHRKDNSFIDYIAEERLRYVAAKASVILGEMTNHRYVLELDAQGGFIIRDQANGGAHRMVTSLSGGETFLTSLSLALALSEQIQLKGQSPLEFFFLDEGFGTLDYDLLDAVIDSLERLSRKERVIGLISHVPELRGRISRRLIVEPPALQGDGSKVSIERS